MPSTIFRSLALTAAVSCSCVWALPDDVLLERGHAAFAERERLTRERDPAYKTAVGDQLADLDARDRIRAMVLWMFSLDESHPNDPRNAQALTIVLGDQPELLENADELRRMLEQEEDPRRFFLISTVASQAVRFHQHDFVSASARMLLRDGAVAKPLGELNPDYIHDVSIPTYGAIVYNLQQLGADYEVPKEDLSHEAKVNHLVRWLRENWPGCEKLGRGVAESPPIGSTRELGSRLPVGERSTPEPVRSRDAEESPSMGWALWIAGAVLALAAVAYFVGLRRKP